MLYNFSHFILWPVFRWVFGFEVVGWEKVPREGPVILCCNHASFLDPPIVGLAMRKRAVWFMARDTLFRQPLFGALIRLLHAFPVKRGGVDRRAWKLFQDLVGSGRAVLVFPEGTRSPDGTLRAGKAGTGMLIRRCPGAAVIPVRIRGSEKALPKGGKWFRRTKIQVAFGSAVPLEGEFALADERDTYQKITDKVMAAIGRL